jgi:glycine/D-amino acid oxidase-like deaminating enzyme
MRHVVVGGGVAGVCCAEELSRLCPRDSIVLVSADRVLKVRCGDTLTAAAPVCTSLLTNMSDAWGSNTANAGGCSCPEESAAACLPACLPAARLPACPRRE